MSRSPARSRSSRCRRSSLAASARPRNHDGGEDLEVVGTGQRRAGDEGGGEAGLDVLLLGVVQEPGVGDGREGRQRHLRLPQRRFGLAGEGGSPFGVALVDGPDAAARGPDDPPAGGEADLAGLVGVGEARPRLVHEGEQIVVAALSQLSPPWSARSSAVGGATQGERRLGRRGLVGRLGRPPGAGAALR